MLKLSASQLALTAILAFAFVLGVGVLSTQASNNGQRAGGALNLPNAVQTAPPPVGTYPPPVPSYPPPIPSHQYPQGTPTTKPTREPRPTATPFRWDRIKMYPDEQR
ncbi:MAG: hypothetical protein M3437_10000 [Chloroflexota bacterium]|nr:hypothetical protein [Chloroflexota bacterium]MDQ5865422.1 hypothetical protein [Chloroflexota bacterium]